VEWIDLLTPSAAVLALFFSIALVVQAWRHGRAIRRIEQRLISNGTAGADAPLERIAQLQQRITTSEGVRPRRNLGAGPPRAVVLGAIAAAVVILGAGGWYFFIRDSGNSGKNSAGTSPGQTSTTDTTPVPPNPTQVPANPPAVDPGTVTVAVFNASGVDGAALNTVGPKLEQQFGYVLGKINNPPDGRSDLKVSVVQWAKGQKAKAANVAHDLGIEKYIPLEGITPEQIDNADVLVIVGLDLATG
jgi:LytR cell envelope-related transcriptional attenuator